MTDTTTSTATALGPLETIQAIYAAFARGDVEAILDRLADDVDWARDVQAPGGAVVPHLRHGVGKATAVAYFQAVVDTMEFHAFSPRLFATTGDHVLVVLDVDMTVRATGRRLAFDEVHEFTVREGKVVRYRPHLDTAQMMEGYRPRSGVSLPG